MSHPFREATFAVVGGRLVHEPGTDASRPALLDWEDGVLVRVDGVAPTQRPCPVPHGAVVEVETPAEESRVDTTVRVAPDGMSARLAVLRRPGARFRLEDQPANRTLTLRRLVLERIASAPPCAADLDAALVAEGVVHGVHADALERLAGGRAAEDVVAEGTRAEEPRDGEVRLVGQPSATVNGGLWSVAAGTVLAHVRHQRNGIDGIDVRGQRVAVRPVRPAQPVPGEGVAVRGETLVAVCDGVAAVRDGRLVVEALHVLEGDVDVRLGDVSVAGSLTLRGGIAEGRGVHVRGRLEVHGPVEGCGVSVGGSAHFAGAVTNAHLTVGAGRRAVRSLADQAAGLPVQFQKARVVLERLVEEARKKGQPLPDARVVGVVLDSYFADAQRTLHEALADAERRRHELGGEPAQELRQAVDLLDAVRRGAMHRDTLREVSNLIGRELGRLLRASQEPLRLELATLQGGIVEVDGDLVVTGRGCVNATLVVEGDVLVPEGAGVRGGVLEVGGVARIAELGSRGGAGATVRLRPGARLEAALVHPGVILELPTGTERIADVRRDLVVAVPRPAQRAA